MVKVHAASANPADWHLLRGTPYFARVVLGLLKPKNKILGIDVAGRVEAVGRSVEQFQPGDEVFGASKFGGFAEYVCAAEDRLQVKPTSKTFACLRF